MTMETEQSSDSDMPGFQFENSGLSRRCNDVFANLDALEKKHKAFEQSRSQDDADADRRLMNQTPDRTETETVSSADSFKRPTVNSGRDYYGSKKGGRHGRERDRQEPFRKPTQPPSSGRGRGVSRGRYGRGRAAPDHKLHPERWTQYSLEDVDTSDSSNKQAALEFLNERRRLREGEIKEDSVNVDSTACSAGHFTFNKPTKTKPSASTSSFSSKTERKSDSRQRLDEYEKMDDDEDVRGNSSYERGSDLDYTKQNYSKRPADSDIAECSGSLKRKLDINDLTEDCEMMPESERPAAFKSRKSAKKNFRSRQRTDDDDDN